MGIRIIAIPVKDLLKVPPEGEAVFYEAKTDERLLSIYVGEGNLVVTIDDPSCPIEKGA